MMDISHRFKLALSDMARRSGLRVAAGLFALLGCGYFLAALWSLLARDLELGPTIASLLIGILCLLVTGILFFISRERRHDLPTTDDVKQELAARANLAGDMAVASVKNRVRNVRNSAVQTATGLFDTARFKADSAAEKLDEGVEKVKTTPPSDLAAEAAMRVGIDPETVKEHIAQTKHAFDSFKSMRAAPAIGLVGAFAVGLAIANRLSSSDEDDEN